MRRSRLYGSTRSLLHDRSPRRGASARGSSGSRSSARAHALASLTELDTEILTLVSTHRVLTQTQLERLFCEVPDRTVRYRTDRLHRLRLLGRTRPYRDKGSAPYHFFPLRAGEAAVRGEAPPRRGERPEPNPSFLAHAALLSELYVALASEGEAAGLTLTRFLREGEAREPFTAPDGKQRAIAPDALVELADEQDRRLLALVELDLGTMSRTRLRLKAQLYVSYAETWAWRERHRFCPALVFLTTTEARALAFLKLLAAEVERRGKCPSYWNDSEGAFEWFVAGAGPYAREPGRTLAEPCLDDRNLVSGLTLAELLAQARAPYERLCAKREQERQRRAQELEWLRSDAEALRRHLHAHEGRAVSRALAAFDAEEHEALSWLVESTSPLDELERQALAAVGAVLGENLLDLDSEQQPRPPGPAERRPVGRLVARVRERQRRQLDQLSLRYGIGPALRRAQARLAGGGLLPPATEQKLEEDARGDASARLRQEERRLAYLERRRRAARELARCRGLAARLLADRAEFAFEVDRRFLRVCRSCEEIAYPADEERIEPDRGWGYSNQHRPSFDRRCHYCGSGALAEWDERHRRRLEQEPTGRDLRPSAPAGLMHNPEDEEPEWWR